MLIRKPSVAGARTLRVALLLALVSAGCSSSSSNSGGGSADASTDVAVDAPAANCVPKGYTGNELGIGAYCDQTTACQMKSTSTFLICTASAGAPPTESFCTTPCTRDTDCGTGAFCVRDPRGSGCVPTQCGGTPADAGSGDAAADGPADAAGDVAAE
jgi:hypothetical protein